MEIPDVHDLTVYTEDSLRDCMLCLDRTAQGICFVVDHDNRLMGLLTDGDIRRSILKGVTLDSPARSVMHSDFVSLPVNSKPFEIQRLLNNMIRHIPLVDDDGKLVDYACLHRLHKIPVMSPVFNGNELKYVTECIKTNWISSQGSFISQFEEKFRDYLGVPHALAVSNGTTALHLAVLSLGIGPGDEVLVPDLTFAASINSVLYAGAVPVLVDVDKDTWTMSLESVKKALTPKTKALMPVHLYGHPCDMGPLVEFARQNGLFIIEDCAESLGSEYNGKLTGTYGDVGAFSFFGNKTITTGEGGMVVFKDRSSYELAAVLRDHGMSKEKRYWHEHIGFNYRMTNLQAAIGVAQMERVEETVVAKRSLAKRYNELIKKQNLVTTPPEASWAKNSYWLYTVLLNNGMEKKRETIMKSMLLNGIDTRPVFYPLHEMPVYSNYVLKNETYSVTSEISARGLSLPSSKELNFDQQSLIVRILGDVIQQQSLSEQCFSGC